MSGDYINALTAERAALGSTSRKPPRTRSRRWNSSSTTRPRVVLENMSKASKPHSLIPAEHSIFTNACVCEHFMLADSSAATLGRLIIWKDTSGLILRSITAGAYRLDTCSTDALTVAAERWCDIIDSTDVDAPEHREARYAHTAIASTLFVYRGTITTSDLSALIDMFNEREQARESGKETLTLSFCDPMHHYGSVNSVERPHRLCCSAHERGRTPAIMRHRKRASGIIECSCKRDKWAQRGKRKQQ